MFSEEAHYELLKDIIILFFLKVETVPSGAMIIH
jgi:hypothetical protein